MPMGLVKLKIHLFFQRDRYEKSLMGISLKEWYGRKMIEWENHLAFRTNNRVVRPFDWGLDWIERWPAAERQPRNGHDAERYLGVLNREAISNSEAFFSYRRPSDFRLEGEMLRFTSA